METGEIPVATFTGGTVEGGENDIQPCAPHDRDRLWTVHEVAEYLQVKPRTIYTWVSEGVIPCIRKGKHMVRFRKEKVDKWLAAFEQRGRRTRRLTAPLIAPELYQ